MQALGEYTLTVNVIMWKVVYESMAILQILFENKLGVLQGDILSPLLFSLFLEDLKNKLA